MIVVNQSGDAVAPDEFDDRATTGRHSALVCQGDPPHFRWNWCVLCPRDSSYEWERTDATASYARVALVAATALMDAIAGACGDGACLFSVRY